MSSKIDMKVVLLGKEYGGKTSLVERFIYGRFDANVPYQNTIGAAFGAKTLSVDNRAITLGIWDTAGSERYEAMSKIYYRGAKAAVVCFDITDATSWERAKFWIREVNGHEETCKVYLCGTKKDLLEMHSRGIDHCDSVDFADSIGSQVFETSSKTGEGIEEMFEAIVKDFVAEPEKTRFEPDQDKISLGTEPVNKGGACPGCAGFFG